MRADAAGERGDDLGVVQVELGVADSGLRFVEGCLRRALLGEPLIGVLDCSEAALLQSVGAT